MLNRQGFKKSPWQARFRGPVAMLGLALLAACGGGGGEVLGGGDGGGDAGPASCSVPDQNNWLRAYFNDAYFWYALAPSPEPSSYATTADYFNALLYTGGTGAFPRDRWSGFESTESFNLFFGDGQTLGYGFAVAGLEITGTPGQPLYVRHVEIGANSPAALAGLQRGDQILSLNGRSTFDIVSADDFSVLSPNAAGQNLTVSYRRGFGVERSVVLTSAIYALTPVPQSQVVTTPLGRRVGYLVVKDMISQTASGLSAAFVNFQAQGVIDVVIDLRYNGGGLVSVGANVASYVGGTAAAGQTYAALLYNDKNAANNSTFRFANPAPAASLGLRRAYVLMGRRTCSASEQVINGLRGAGIEVVAIGETTCGKPVGFLPTSQCGTTYSVVNFESVNARNEGRYFEGFAPTCAVAEDWTQALGSNAEPLLAAARRMIDGGSCPTAAAREFPLSRRKATPGAEPGERQGMLSR